MFHLECAFSPLTPLLTSGYDDGFSCADPGWDAAKWGINRRGSVFGFQNSYTSRCVGLSNSVTASNATASATYSNRAGCFPMGCVGGNLQVTAPPLNFRHSYNAGLLGRSKHALWCS